MAEFDLQQIYTALASYKGLPFPIGINQLPSYKIKQFENRIGILKGERDIKSIYGQPVIMPVTIDDVVLGTGEDENTHLTIQPMVVFEGKKRIVTNEIGGGSYSGTIKEFINLDDYKISIIGAVVNRNQKEYPHEQVNILKNLWKKNQALSFDCALTNDLFDYVVFQDIKFKELSKSPGIQAYEIKAISDAVLEVEQLKGE